MCIKNKSSLAPEIGLYKCKSCGVVSKKKKKLCKPKKIKARK